MIKNYNIFKLNEGITLSSKDIVDILKNLETSNNKNEELINRLINYKDKKSVNMLMHIVSSKNKELIDYILKFNIDLQHVDKNNQNVLFYAKDLDTFNKLYNLGVDITLKNNKGRNILNHLATKRLFDVELYQQLINAGIDINELDNDGHNALTMSILNQKILNLFIKNGAKLNEPIAQGNFLWILLNKLEWQKYNKISVIKLFDILFKNGMIIQNKEKFISKLIDINNYTEDIDIIDQFIKPFKNYLSENFIELLIKKFIDRYIFDKKILIKKINEILNLGIFPNIYKFLVKYYRIINENDEIKKMLNDYKEKHPYIEDSEKYNL